MLILRSLLWNAAVRAATDPRTRQTAGRAARALGQRVRPLADQAAIELRGALREAPPAENPLRFLKRLRDRLDERP